MHLITSARRTRLPVLVAAAVVLALSLACNGGDPPAVPTPAPTSENIDAAIAAAVATAVAEAATDPAPDPSPGTTDALDDREKAIAAAVAEAVATALAGAAADPTSSTPSPGPGLTPTLENREEAIATAVAEAVATASAGSTPSPGPVPTPGPIPTPSPAPTVDDGAGATATAAAEINAASHALGLAVTEVFEKLVTNPNTSPADRAAAIAEASSRHNADPIAVATAVAEAYDNPITPTPNATEIFIATANAGSEATALAAVRSAADATEAANQATASAYGEYIATATAAAGAAATPTYAPPPIQRYDSWNDHEWLAEPKPWWRASSPYNCDPPPNPNSPWTAAGLPDLGGSDPLSLIRWFGNGSYVRYGLMGFEGCTFMGKHPTRTHLDTPADPAYYSLGDLEIAVDIARVPVGAPEWPNDDGSRVDMSMAEAVDALNTHVAAYFRKISQGKLRMRFVPGHDFQASGRGTPQEVEDQWLALIGVVGCDPNDPNRPGCRWGMPGALNRFILNDVRSSSGGSAWNGYADFGLVSLKHAVMPTLVHEIGHGWMFWPHSYVELPWRPDPSGPYQGPNFYSNRHDFMSELTPSRPNGWRQDMPATLAINRYAAGWIEPGDVALHLSDRGTYRLARPMERGRQFLVIHSGRPGAFTTLEVLDERNAIYRDAYAVVYDPASPGQRRPIRYDGVLVSRYDQTSGTGFNARVGPALYDAANPSYESDVGYGRDDYSVIADGESRAVGGGVTVSVTKNTDGSYDVTVSGGRIAAYEPWCIPIWFPPGGYDTGCMLEGFNLN